MGPLTVIGVCIPWKDAHVRTGRKDRDPWQDHLAWLAGFEKLPYRRAASARSLMTMTASHVAPRVGR